MRIKKFEAASVQEALQKVKQDLGPEAVILYTKKLKKGGFLGWLGTEFVEITAGIDVPLLENEAKAVSGNGFPVESKNRSRRQTKQVANEDDVLKKPNWVLPKPLNAPDRRAEVFQSELNEGKVLSGAGWTRQTSSIKTGLWNPQVARYEKVLQKNGVDEEIVKQVLDLASREIENHGFPEESVGKLIKTSIGSFIKAGGPVDAKGGGSKVVAFIGPTGVGKSTTLVKLASQYALIHKLKVGMITADTYRIGAVEQLKIYRDIIDIPLEAVNSTDELEEALKRQADRDLIFFDTAGRSPQNRKQIQDLRSFFEVAQPHQTHLVISATTKGEDLLPIVSKFGLVPVHRLLFTKLDETRTYGIILNASAQFGIPISYVTIGQNVPHDIEVASSEKLAELVLGDGRGRSG